MIKYYHVTKKDFYWSTLKLSSQWDVQNILGRNKKEGTGETA